MFTEYLLFTGTLKMPRICGADSLEGEMGLEEMTQYLIKQRRLREVTPGQGCPSASGSKQVSFRKDLKGARRTGEGSM